jgi:hypothetical protein
MELQDRYSAIVDAKLRHEIVQKNGFVWNNKYEGNPKAGAVKIPVRDTEATVVSYNKQSGAAKSYASGSFITLPISKDKAVNELIDGYEAEAVPDNIIADRIDSAGYSLAMQINEDSTAELLDKATVKGQSSATSKSNVYDRLVDIKTAMTKAKVPASGRFALVNPDTMNLVLKSAEFTAASSLGDEVKQSGAVGRIAGFLVFEDATLPDHANIICGHPNWCCRVEEWQNDIHVQSLDGSGSYIGASAVQGRKIYDHLVTKSAAVVMDSGVLTPTIAIASNAATVTTGTNGTGSKYRVYDASAETWGDWTTYSAAVSLDSNDKIEVYSYDADGVRSGIVSDTND